MEEGNSDDVDPHRKKCHIYSKYYPTKVQQVTQDPICLANRQPTVSTTQSTAYVSLMFILKPPQTSTCFHTQLEVKCQQVQERAEKREQELSNRLTSLEEAGIQAENQVKELKETIFELEDQVEQQRAVNCHTNQTVLDMESMYRSLAVQFYMRLK